MKLIEWRVAEADLGKFVPCWSFTIRADFTVTVTFPRWTAVVVDATLSCQYPSTMAIVPSPCPKPSLITCFWGCSNLDINFALTLSGLNANENAMQANLLNQMLAMPVCALGAQFDPQLRSPRVQQRKIAAIFCKQTVPSGSLNKALKSIHLKTLSFSQQFAFAPVPCNGFTSFAIKMEQ